MKKHIFTSITILTILLRYDFSFAQPVGAGGDPSLYGSVSGGSHSGSNFAGLNPQFEIGLEIKNNHPQSLLVGLNLDWNAKYDANTHEIFGNTGVNHLKLPVLYKFNPSKNFHIYGGLAANYILGFNEEGTLTSWNNFKNNAELFSDFNQIYNHRLSADVVGGIEVGFQNRGPNLYLRYSYCFTEANRDLQNIDIGVRVKFGKNNLINRHLNLK